MFLIVGLGNPGKKYENTYHNVGFKMLENFAETKKVKLTKKKGQALIFDGKINGKKVVLAKPQTYMNLSGVSVKSLSKKYKVDSKNIIVVYDDVDLELGEVRFRNSGSGGTHNGMKNIVSVMNTTEIKRIRIGISKGSGDLAQYVLKNINKTAQQEIQKAIEKACLLVDEILENDGEMENKSA